MTMTDLLADLIGQRVCVWFQGRQSVGTLCGVGDGLVCVDLTGPAGDVVRTFISLATLTAIRAMPAESPQG